MNNRDSIWINILDERLRQDEKFGQQNGHTRETWFTILGEEVGEVGKAILESQDHEIRDELVQVAAVAVSFIEKLDSGALAES